MSLVEGPVSVLVIDPGYDAAEARAVEGTSVAELVGYADSRHKTVAYVVLTHHHWDHIYNLRVLEQLWPHLRVIAHTRTPLSHAGLIRVERDAERLFDGIRLRLIPTPGHSELGDDLSVLLPEAGILFCGDLWQPQGPRYDWADAPSPVPLYHDGRAYLASLARLLALEYDVLRTGHDATLDRLAAVSGFEVTRQTVLRTRELALAGLTALVDAGLDDVCWWVFERLAGERGWTQADILARRSAETYPGAADYERCDKPGILYWVKEAARGC